MFRQPRFLSRTAPSPVASAETSAPRSSAPGARPRLASLTTLNIGLTAVAAIGPKRIRPHAQAILALIGAVQAIISLLRKG